MAGRIPRDNTPSRPCQQLSGWLKRQEEHSPLGVKVLLSLESEAAEAMPAVWTWMAGKGGEEPRCLCLLYVFKWCAHRGMRRPEPCQLCGAGWLAREEKSRGVFVFSLCSSSAALAMERGS